MNHFWKYIGIFVLLVLAWITYPCIVRSIASSKQGQSNQSSRRWEESGQFGDTYGGFTSLFTALAFLTAGYAAYLQYKTLELQRQTTAMAHAPDISWNPPTLRIIGLVQSVNGKAALALSLDNILCNSGKESAINLISRCTLSDENDNQIASAAASYEGMRIDPEQSAQGFHYMVVNDYDRARHLLENLVKRASVNVRFESWYSGLIAVTLYKSINYALDCPSDHSRAYCQSLLDRLNDNTVGEKDQVAMDVFAKGLSSVVTTGQDTFITEFACSITRLAPIESRIVDGFEYEKVRKAIRLIIKANMLPIRGMQHSFYVAKFAKATS